jgi:hypothetical protein
MSSFLAGYLVRQRAIRKPGDNLAYSSISSDVGHRRQLLAVRHSDDVGAETTLVPIEVTETEGVEGDKVKKAQEVIATLVPAEVLAIHGVLMATGTQVTGEGDSADTVISYPGWMQVGFWGCILLSAVLYLAGRKGLKEPLAWVGALLTAVAFVLWTLLQPVSALKAFDLPPIPQFGYTVIALIGGALLAVAVSAVSGKTEKAQPETTA